MHRATSFSSIDASGVLGIMLLSSVAVAQAADLNIAGPPGSVAFGTLVIALPNGNIVVTDPSGPAANIGAVYLYSADGILISSLTGGSSGDSVGSGGITVLANGNFLVRSPAWRNPATAAVSAGAVTWINAASGLSGVVSEANSLVGTSADDEIGAYQLIVLDNGNYVVPAPHWDNGPLTDAGAVIWGNGGAGVSGPVAINNALFGTHASDQVGRSVVPLSNGNYVVGSFTWDNGAIANAGASTWANGSSGIVGAVSPGNSLVGTSSADFVGIGGTTALANGNYLVSSYNWRNGAASSAGAVTWANGSSALIGVVSPANSLVGSSAGDQVGGGGSFALTNGNYVVSSINWANGTNSNAGAATWGSGTTGVSGTISASNSLVGASSDDGSPPATASFDPIVALSNGNYIVVNPGWNSGGVADVGAVTWGNGASGRTGVISAANSLIGLTAGDSIGSRTSVALANGNYVVASDRWQNGGSTNAGAATWGNGSGGSIGVVSAANSLVGSSVNDRVGRSIYSLANGNYVVASESWDNAAIVDAGAVTWGNGNTGRIGVVSPSNSLIGGKAGDAYGLRILTLSNGDFIAGSNRWDNAAIVNAGAFTVVGGSGGLIGVPSAGNSILGSLTEDNVSFGTLKKLGDNHYAIISKLWDNGGSIDAGAVTILQNSARSRGLLSTANSVLGNPTGGGATLNVTHDSFLNRAMVGRPAENLVTVRALALFADGFD